MPRLLVLSQTHNLWGGIETWMTDLFPTLEQAGWDVHFGLAWGARFNSPERFLRQHSYIKRWKPLDGRVGTATSRLRAVVAELRRLAPDVVMPVALGDALPGLRAYRHGGGRARILVPVHSTHTGTLADIKSHRDLIDGVGSVSGLLYRWTRAALGREGPERFWIRNGVSAPIETRRQSQNGAFRVGYVGRLDADVKRSHDLVGIMASLRSTVVPVSLRVVGDGPMAAVLEAGLREAPNLIDCTMHGFVPRTRLYQDVYPDLDCLILTSTTEGSPLAVIEAMRHGIVPVVSRFHGYAAEGLLIPGGNCLMFPVGDHAEAAACIQRLAESPGLHQRLSSEAVANTQSCDTDEMVKGWDRALRLVLAAPASATEADARQVRGSHGRFERWGIPAAVADGMRRLGHSHFPHPAGFDEWPGSLNTDRALEDTIRNDLSAIEASCSTRLSDLDAACDLKLSP